MFVLKRNQIIITALVVMVAVAGYLNYIDTNSTKPSSITLNDEGEVLALVPNIKTANGADSIEVNASLNTTNKGETETNEVLVVAEGEIGDALTVADNPEIATEYSNAQTVPGNNTENLPSEPGAAVFVNKTMNSTYFVEAKLDREQSRAKQKEILTEMINNTNIEQAKRADCATAMLEIQKRIEKETAAEAMIEAKGFSEAYVRIDDDTVDVVVSKEALSDAEIAQIEDIVKRKTGMAAEKIRISPMKK